MEQKSVLQMVCSIVKYRFYTYFKVDGLTYRYSNSFSQYLDLVYKRHFEDALFAWKFYFFAIRILRSLRWAIIRAQC